MTSASLFFGKVAKLSGILTYSRCQDSREYQMERKMLSHFYF